MYIKTFSNYINENTNVNMQEIDNMLSSLDLNLVDKAMKIASTNKDEFEKYFGVKYEDTCSFFEISKDKYNFKNDEPNIKYKNIKLSLLFLKKSKKLRFEQDSGSKVFNLDLDYIFDKIYNYIECLYINQCGLKELPNEIGMLQKLKKLSMFSNKLSKLPNDFSKLKNIEYLNLSDNDFYEIPNQIASLKKLYHLDLNNTGAKDLTQLFELKNLTTLKLSNNNISSIPKEFCNLTNLEYLHLSDNDISELPIEFSNLKKLRFLELQDNNISKIEIKKIKNLLPSKCEFLY